MEEYSIGAHSGTEVSCRERSTIGTRILYKQCDDAS